MQTKRRSLKQAILQILKAFEITEEGELVDTLTDTAIDILSDGQKSNSTPPSRKPEKKGDLIDGWLFYGQQHKDEPDFGWIDEYLRPRAYAFWKASGIVPSSGERSLWRAELGEQYHEGISIQTMETVIKKMRMSGLTIKSPASIHAMAKDLQAQAQQQHEHGTEMRVVK